MHIHFLSILTLSFLHQLQSLLNRLIHTNFVVISNFQVVSIDVFYLNSLIPISSFFVIQKVQKLEFFIITFFIVIYVHLPY